MKKILSFFVIVSMIFTNSVSISRANFSETKISPELNETIESLQDEDELAVYVILSDIDHDAVLKEFETIYPEQYNEYCLAKDGDIAAEMRQIINGNIDEKENYIEFDDPLDGELLQQAIETKRELSASAYIEQNKGFADSFVSSDKQIFVSAYSPLLILSLSKTKVLEANEHDLVSRIELFEDKKGEDVLAVANAISRADYVRDSNGNKGYGVKIGQIESGVPQTGISDLQNASITRHSTSSPTSHATYVARILVGSSNGIAPQASLYSTGYSSTSDFYSNAEWLVSQGVNVINMSNGVSNVGTYDVLSQWVDHIAVQHDIHFVAASGNSDNHIVYSPAMAYNAISVGGFDDHGSLTHSNHTRYNQSCYIESSSTNRPEKPNIIASAVNIEAGTNGTGTSAAAPQVTGVIAQLCSYQSGLKVKQTVVGAMLSAGAKYKLEGTSGSGSYPDTFSSSIRVNGSTQISKFEGAGKLDARCPRSVASSGNYWSPTINTSYFPYTQSIYISTSSNSNVRVSIFWLKRNSISTSSHTPGTVSQTTFTDLDLYVYAPNGSLVGSSSTTYSNYEIVQFQPSQTGTYTIKITRNGSSTSTKEHVGIAVW